MEEQIGEHYGETARETRGKRNNVGQRNKIETN